LPHARQIHDAGDASAVFSFGDSLIVKIRIANDNTTGDGELLAETGRSPRPAG
jgi:hypothetical protein